MGASNADYERQFKEIVAKAKAAYGTGAYDDSTLEFLIPGLCESEDERIRKLLVWQVYRNIEDETNDLAQSVYDGIKGHDPDIEESIEDWKKCLAYLEKQKEQKPAEVKDPFSNANFVRGYESGYADAKREQKPIQTSEEKEYIRTIKSLISDFVYDKQPQDVVYYQRVYDWLDGRHIEQKPNIELIQRSWYMEGYHDREFGKEPKWIIKTGEGGPRHELNPKYGQPLAEEQRPVEGKEYSSPECGTTAGVWSEEDEKMIDNLIRFFNEKLVILGEAENAENTVQYVSYKKVIDWLKSLRPSWKPSEEQMKAFKGYIEDFQAKAEAAVGGWNNFDVMIRLYEQLKKLM